MIGASPGPHGGVGGLDRQRGSRGVGCPPRLVALASRSDAIGHRLEVAGAEPGIGSQLLEFALGVAAWRMAGGLSSSSG